MDTHNETVFDMLDTLKVIFITNVAWCFILYVLGFSVIVVVVMGWLLGGGWFLGGLLLLLRIL